MTVKLYEIPRNSKIYGLSPDGHEGGVVEFDHLDGMYSYCRAYTASGALLGICHVSAFTTLEPSLDGYRVRDDS